MKIYFIDKEGKPIDAFSLNAIFSAIYTPIVPVDHSMGKNYLHYKKGGNDFFVGEENGKSFVDGEISSNLIKKLQSYGVEKRN